MTENKTSLVDWDALEREEEKRFIREAETYIENTDGVIKNLTDTVAHYMDELEDLKAKSTPSPRPPITASPIGLLVPSALPKRQFLYGTHLIRKYCSATLSPGGVGKTQLVMTDALSMVTGRQLLHDTPHEGKTRAWHYNLEDPYDELLRRVAAIAQQHEIDFADIQNDLFLNSGRDAPLIVVEKTISGTYAKPHADELYRAIKENGISSLSIDPFVKVHYTDENSNKDIDYVSSVFAQIANDTGCAIDLVHHTKKQGKESYAGNMESARGASALSGAVRAARTISQMTGEEAEGFGLEASKRTWYLRIDDAKQNMAPPSSKTAWVERQSVELENGDKVGCLSYWKPPALFEGITKEKIVEMFEQINEAEYRKDTRSPDWVGNFVMSSLGVNKDQAKKMVYEWLKSNVMATVTAYNGQKNKVVIVRCFPEKMKV